MLKGLIGKKIGMTQVFDENGVAYPVTLIEAGPCFVTQVRTTEKEEYLAVQLGFGEVNPKKLTNGEIGHLKTNEIPPLKFLREFRSKDHGLKVGDKVTVADAFAAGERVDVIGISKGKGFAGTVKRWNFGMQDATHGNSRSHRVPGSSGQCQSPGRVFKNKKMSGHLGAERVTVQNLEIVRVDVERNLILVKGAIPGAPGGDVIVRPAVKARSNG